MRIAYLDCFSGISGDMFLGALVDAGVSPKLLEDTVAALNIGAHLEISRVQRSGISATKVDVYAHGEKDQPREVFLAERKPEHAHEHSAGHVHEHSHASGHHHGRALSEIRRVIEQSAISSAAKATAIRIFENLGEAEAKIHNASIEQVHFHEVGAVDAMVDIVCAAVGAESLAVEQWICSPLNVGGIPFRPISLSRVRQAPVSGKGALTPPTRSPLAALTYSRLLSSSWKFMPTFGSLTVSLCLPAAKLVPPANGPV